jgi:hypothetical protein
MTVSDLLEQPCNKSDNIDKVVASVKKLFQTCWQLGTSSANTIVEDLLGDLLQDVRFLRL